MPAVVDPQPTPFIAPLVQLYARQQVVTKTVWANNSSPTTTPYSPSSSSPKFPIASIVGGCVAGIVLACACSFAWVWWGRCIKRKERKRRVEILADLATRENTRKNSSIPVVRPPPPRPSLTSPDRKPGIKFAAPTRPSTDGSATPSVASMDMSEKDPQGPSLQSLPVSPSSSVPSLVTPPQSLSRHAPTRPSPLRTAVRPPSRLWRPSYPTKEPESLDPTGSATPPTPTPTGGVRASLAFQSRSLAPGKGPSVIVTPPTPVPNGSPIAEPVERRTSRRVRPKRPVGNVSAPSAYSEEGGETGSQNTAPNRASVSVKSRLSTWARGSGPAYSTLSEDGSDENALRRDAVAPESPSRPTQDDDA